MSKRKLGTWKKHFRKVPETVLAKVNRIAGDDFKVACVKRIPAADIAAGNYAHIGLLLKEDELEFPKEQLPASSNGRYSRINVQGEELVLRDEPMISKTYTIEAPNWGDWNNGTHDVEWDRMVYQRQWFAPKELTLEIELLAEEGKAEKVFVIRFAINEVLNRKSLRFRKLAVLSNELFFNLNLLQENVGAADIYASSATRDDYLKTLYVNWEILPPGERNETIAKIISSFKSPSPAVRARIAERYDFLIKLKPEGFIAGTSGFRRYFGAKFSESLVVFENLEHGNAIYAMFEDWETLSKSSRTELLKGSKTGFERIVHSKTWKRRLKELVQSKLKPAA
jgi:hypothetical protein